MMMMIITIRVVDPDSMILLIRIGIPDPGSGFMTKKVKKK
jgi:hypothetical protein